METQKIFETELWKINDPKIKSFVLTCFEKLTPDYFETCPTSTSGKYHPQISLGKGGLLRHVKLAIWWGIELIRCWPNLYETAQDELVASLLLHDLKKNGEQLDSGGYPTMDNATKIHGIYLADKILGILEAKPTESEHRIIEAIRYHMGIWTEGEDTPFTIIDPKTKDLAIIVHLADYLASRKVDEKMKVLQGVQNGSDSS